MRRARRPLTAAALVLLGLAAAGVAAQEMRRASNGAEVPTPALDGLDCAAMQATLDAIDATRYRSAAPVPADHPDRAIFDYENDLSERTFERCMTPEAILQDAGEAFAHGFEPAAGEAGDGSGAGTGDAAPAAAAVAEPAAPAAESAPADEQ